MEEMVCKYCCYFVNDDGLPYKIVWQESCRTFRSADELPHLPLVFNISYKEKLSF